jgi:hypothetical protein
MFSTFTGIAGGGPWCACGLLQPLNTTPAQASVAKTKVLAQNSGLDCLCKVIRLEMIISC